MDKNDIRARIRTRKTLLDQSERTDAAVRVFDALASMAAFTLADRILVYNSLPDELSTREFIARWKDRKHFYLPRVNGPDLEILPYDSSRTHLGSFHIEEPDGDDLTDIADIDLIIVPAVAYDRCGNRVGRGKGYYDRLLARARAITVGVCYDFQLLDDGLIEADSHDIPVNFIVADRRGIFRVERRR